MNNRLASDLVFLVGGEGVYNINADLTSGILFQCNEAKALITEAPGTHRTEHHNCAGQQASQRKHQASPRCGAVPFFPYISLKTSHIHLGLGTMYASTA